MQKNLKRTSAHEEANFEECITSLDRKIERKRTERGKTMVLEIEAGEDSTRGALADCPEWGKTIFD